MTARGPTVAHVVLSLDVGGLQGVALGAASEGRSPGLRAGASLDRMDVPRLASRPGRPRRHETPRSSAASGGDL